jgi:GrpB-like predicted nucleotidyltransferase (UPF0157 family)
MAQFGRSMPLAVPDASKEAPYVPPLRSLGYQLTVRELQRPDPPANLHIFSVGCPEVERMLAFRAFLRQDRSDRELYAATKLSLAEASWENVQDDADATSPVVEEILARARRRLDRGTEAL